MPNVSIEETVPFPNSCDNRRIRVTVSAGDITVLVDNPLAPLLQRRAVIAWEQLNDVEHLAQLFEMETVKVFKVVVTMLAKVAAAKDFYKALE